MKPYFETELGKLYCGDCMEIMTEFPDDYFDLCLTDPPYGINKAEWDKEMPIDWFGKLYNKLKLSGVFYIFGDSLILSRFQIFWENEGIKWSNRCVWVYESGPRNSNTWTSKHEDCLVMRLENHNQKTPKELSIHKDPRWGNYRYIGDVWKYNRVLNNYSERVEHLTQKPEELMLMIISAATEENNLVIDPFMGSGTTAVSCEKINRHWVGVEINEKYCEIAAKRIEKEAKQGKFDL